MVRPGARQELDLVGPRYLAGATAFHALNAADVGRRRCGIEILASKEERVVAEGWCACGAGSGCPRWPSSTTARPCRAVAWVLALPVRLCLALGAQVRYIPFAEPWRNGVVEHFNDVFDKRFLRTEQFHGLDHLARRAQVFEDFHNAHHRYSALHGATQAEWEARWQWTPRLLDPTFTPPTALPRRGQIDFVRLIRSDRLLKILGVKLPGTRDAGPSLCHGHPAGAPRAARRHLRGPVAHGGSLHPQAMSGTMPCCLHCPAP